MTAAAGVPPEEPTEAPCETPSEAAGPVEGDRQPETAQLPETAGPAAEGDRLSEAAGPVEGDRQPETARLPEAVRLRVVSVTADRLGVLPPEQIPPSLRRVARFAPAKRSRLGAVAIGSALESDPEFRESIAAALREGLPELAAALESGSPLPTLPIDEVAAAAYLLRSAGWESLVEDAAAAAAEAESAASRSATARVVTRLQEQLDAVRAERLLEAERLRAELATSRAEVAVLRRRLGEARDRARAAEAEAARLAAETETERAEAAAAVLAAEAETRRLRGRLAEADSALEGARRAAREGRSAADVRLRMLLDTVVDAASGLRRELALPPATERPADAVAAEMLAAGGDGEAPPAARGLAPDDPALIEELLALPRVHVIVDGYNVTKTGYGTLPLEVQRNRLVSSLAGLVARTGAEVTVVFDGTDVQGVRVSTPRGVRMIFSMPGELADDRIRLLVAAEPAGRPLVVVSSDREVAEASRRAGAHPVGSAGLLRILGRG